MRFTVHNVGHGLCVSLIHENGNVMLWDCGHSDNNRPSEFLPQLGITVIEELIITNYDEDHISNLPNLSQRLPIRSMIRNKSISSQQLRTLKLIGGPISNAMAFLLNLIDEYIGGPPNPAYEYPGVRRVVYQNTFNQPFMDTNNISLVTFIECNGTKFVIPGDVEADGWDALLQQPGFIDELAVVNVFIASHHGRRNGYNPRVLEIASPNVVVFSDSNIQFATQEMAQVYHSHASGVTFNGQTRHVLTTRNDGSIQWDI